MCGIAGFVGNGDERDLQQMVTSLTHRGPDDAGLFIDSSIPIYFGSRRLSVIDLLNGSQPMQTIDKELVVIFNGEIYNAQDLRQSLIEHGYVFKTNHSDTEVLLHGYREWDLGLMDKLNGMWAFALYDKQKERLLLCRDRFGEKPFYYTFQNGTFAFASELRSFQHHRDLTLTLSKRGLQKYCAHGYFPGDHTPYEGIYKLLGGCYLIRNIKTRSHRIERYWSYRIEPEEGDSKHSQNKWVNDIQDLLEKSVKRRLISDVPLGVFLSGGLDSSTVTFFASQYKPREELRTFSVGFSESSFDETTSAKFVSDLLHTQHTVAKFSTKILPSIIEEVFSKLDEPLSDSSLMSQFLLSKLAHQDVTVALGGDASDELFSGYDTFKAIQVATVLEKMLPKSVHRGITALLGFLHPSHSYMSLGFKIERLLKGSGHEKSLWHPLWLSPVSCEEINELFDMRIDLEDLYSEAIYEWESSNQDNVVDKSLQFYGNIFLQNQILTKVDRMSMMHGLEVRTPFLDIDLVNCVRKIPHYYKLRNGQTKYILKKAMDGLLPSSIVWKRKIGFSAPLSKWFYGGSISSEYGHIWGKRATMLIQSKIKEHKSLKRDHRLFLWNIYALSRFIENCKLSL